MVIYKMPPFNFTLSDPERSNPMSLGSNIESYGICLYGRYVVDYLHNALEFDIFSICVVVDL